jgi:hypothetical protein
MSAEESRKALSEFPLPLFENQETPMFWKPRKTRRVERANRFGLAHLTIIGIVAVFGAASVAGVLFTIDAMSVTGYAKWTLMGLGSVLAFTVAVAPVMSAPAWTDASGWMKVAGLPLIAMLMMIDAGLQMNAAMTAERLLKGDGKTVAMEALVAAEEKLAALPTSEEICKGHGPQNCAARQEGLQADRETFTAERDAAKAEIRAEQKSKLPMTFISLALAAFQVSTFFMRAWLSGVTRMREAKLKAERQAAKPKRKTRKPAKAQKPEPFRPYLVYANDNAFTQ